MKEHEERALRRSREHQRQARSARAFYRENEKSDFDDATQLSSIARRRKSFLKLTKENRILDLTWTLERVDTATAKRLLQERIES